MPICNTCRAEKPVSDFSPNRWTKSGHTNKCHVCCAAYAKTFRQRNPDKVRKWEKEKRAKWRAKTPFRRQPRTTSEGRLCTRCQSRKDPSEFGRCINIPGNLSHNCKDCMRSYARQRRYSDIELSRAKERLKARKQYENNREKIKEARSHERLTYKYGLSKSLLADLLAIQDGLCAICGRTLSLDSHAPKLDRANVDHDHATGAVRGLLCLKCNNGLGSFGDNRNSLIAAITYLDQHHEAAPPKG